MFGKQHNMTKEINSLEKQNQDLRQKLFAKIALELATIELPTGPRKEIKQLTENFYKGLTTKYNHWSLEELDGILTSLKSPKSYFMQSKQVGIVYGKRLIAYLDNPKTHEIQNLTLPKKIRHHNFENKDFTLEEVIFMSINPKTPLTPEFSNYYVLRETNTLNIYAVMPTKNQFHDQQLGIFTLLDTETFPNSHKFVLTPATKISHFADLNELQGSKIVIDTKYQTITKLGANKIQNMFTSRDWQTTAFSLLRPRKIFTRHYINLATGKYVQSPLLAMPETSAENLNTAQNVEILQKLSGKYRIDPAMLTTTIKNAEKYDGKPVPETHFVVKNGLGETFLAGKRNIDAKDMPIFANENGELLVQVDYPQSILVEEVYGTKGQLFNTRFYDYSGHRLKVHAKDEGIKEISENLTTKVDHNTQNLEQ